MRYAHEVDERVDVLDKDGAQIAHQRTREVVVGGVRTAEDEGTTVEEATLGVVVEVDGHGIGATSVVGVVESGCRNGNEFALVVGGAAGLGIPFHASGPEDVGFTVTHAVDIAFEVVVGGEGTVMHKLLVELDSVELVALSPFGFSACCQKFAKDIHLDFLGMAGIGGYFAVAGCEKGLYDASEHAWGYGLEVREDEGEDASLNWRA